MRPGAWYRISGDAPDLDLQPTPAGTRYLVDNDPGRDARLNPPYSLKERLRRSAGRAPLSPWHGRAGFPAITECWNGAILASRLGRAGSVVCFGGGHDDYYGSDVHRFDLHTRQWTRALDGYTAGSPHDYGAGAVYPDSTYPDGSPLPPHTYDYVQYDAHNNDLILFKGQTELGPNVQAVPIPHLLDLDAWQWRRGARHPEAIFNSGGWTTWDAARRRLWGHSGDDGGGNGLSWFAPDGRNDDGTWGRWGPLYPSKLPGRANHNAMQIDPRVDLIVIAAHGDACLYGLDPEDPSPPPTPLGTQGDAPRLQPFAALEYSEALDCLVYFSAADSPDVYLLRRPPDVSRASALRDRWQWLRLAADPKGREPVTEAARMSRAQIHPSHVFGRFRCIDYADATLAVLLRHVDSPVYAMRLQRAHRAPA